MGGDSPPPKDDGVMANAQIHGSAGEWLGLNAHEFRRWLFSLNGRACGLSLLIHAVLIGGLSLAVFRNNTRDMAFTLISRNVPQGELAENSGLDNVLKPGNTNSAPASEIESALPVLRSAAADLLATTDNSPGLYAPEPGGSAPVSLDSAVEIERPGDLLQGIGIGAGEGTGKGRGQGLPMGNLTEGYSMPGGGKVVSKGRFSAWTVPTDPRPRQSYLIVIQVDWPKTTDRRKLQARRFDLSGTVVGSDTYFQSIERTGQFVPRANQMIIPVPGGEQNVRDVIQVHSKLLNESQELAIVF